MARSASTVNLATCAVAGMLGCAALRPGPAAAQSVFPGAAWQPASSGEALGWSPARLAALERSVDSVGSAAFMIVTRGQVVAAWGDTARTFLTHSVRKSFMSGLYGMAVAEGKIDTAATLGDLGVGETGIRLTPTEQSARVVDLLRARSGVYLAAAGEIAAMRDARPARGSHAPGTFWYYNNWDFNVLGTVYRERTGEDIFQAIDRRIARPIGMQDFRPQDGEYGVEEPSRHPAYIFRISARDLARFGLLYLHRGRWRDTQLVPASWVDASVRSYSATGDQGSRVTKSGYGFMWWIETGTASSSFTASGNGGQRLTVIPAIETVVVNLMNTDAPGSRLNSNQWDALIGIVLAARRP